MDYIIDHRTGPDYRTPNAVNDKTMTKKELSLKTSSEGRTLPIPDYVFEAILEERKIYEKIEAVKKHGF